MYIKRKNSKRSWSVVASVGVGLILSILLSLAGAMLLTALIDKEAINQLSIDIPLVVIYMIAAFSGSYLSGKIAGENKQYIPLIIGAVYLVLLLSIKFMFFNGAFNNITTGLISILFAVILSNLLVIRTKQKPKNKKMRAHFR